MLAFGSAAQAAVAADSTLDHSAVDRFVNSHLENQRIPGLALANIDRPASDYLPEFTLATPAAAAAITVRQLLDHTSGLARQQETLAVMPEIIIFLVVCGGLGALNGMVRLVFLICPVRRPVAGFA